MVKQAVATGPKETAKERRARHRSKLVTLQDAEAEYGPPYSSLYELVAQGSLPRVQLGDSRRIWVRREDLERLIGG